MSLNFLLKEKFTLIFQTTSVNKVLMSLNNLMIISHMI